MVRVQEKLYYQEPGVISYYNDAIFTGSNANIASTVVNFSTKTLDPRNLVTTGANWQFKSPRARVYTIKAIVQLDASPEAGSGFDDVFEQYWFTGNEVVTSPSAGAILYKSGSAGQFFLLSGGGSSLIYDQYNGTHYHQISGAQVFQRTGYTIGLRRNGSPITAGVFTQNPSISAVVDVQPLTLTPSITEGQNITGWVETTIELDTNDAIDVVFTAGNAPLSVTVGGVPKEFIKYNVSAKAYIFITEISKRK